MRKLEHGRRFRRRSPARFRDNPWRRTVRNAPSQRIETVAVRAERLPARRLGATDVADPHRIRRRLVGALEPATSGRGVLVLAIFQLGHQAAQTLRPRSWPGRTGGIEMTAGLAPEACGERDR